MKVPVGISTVVAVLTIFATGIAAVVTALDGAGVAVPLTLTIIAGVVSSVLSVVRSWQANTQMIWSTDDSSSVTTQDFNDFVAGMND
jgi:hypothetical protein